MKISQVGCVRDFFNKVSGPQNCNFIKKRLQHRFFSCEFCKLSKTTYFVEDLWTADSETPENLSKDTFFDRTSPLAAYGIFRFPACNLIKKETWAKVFICEFCKIFKNIFWQNNSGWLLLVFICEFWVFQLTSFMEHFWGTAYFIWKVPNSNHYIQ